MEDLSDDQKVPSMTNEPVPSYEPANIEKARQFFVQTLPHRVTSTRQVDKCIIFCILS